MGHNILTDRIKINDLFVLGRGGGVAISVRWCIACVDCRRVVTADL